MTRYACVHGHFYQPPRENPWLDVVEEQPSAAPYRDWNHRVTAESYRPNTAARVLSDDGRIGRILNNYGGISFNIGPTLLAWMERADADTYRAILRGDQEAADRFGGFGSALAMPYNHMIMPLASAADVRTQVAWGVRDFEWRFGRRPDGMWLPETAVDLPTLEALAEAGIRFTVLAPRQARRFRAPDGGQWIDVTDGNGIDPKRPYRQRLPSGVEIAVFFYDGPISAAVAFEDLLADGERLAERLEGAFDRERAGDQLVHIATDGETFGHHHTYGEMALAYVLDRFEAGSHIALTNYAQYLERHPPEWEVEIAENSSWSCAHGIERWRADCGCSTGARPEWSQAWRAPLREALDGLRDAMAERFEAEARELLLDPWAARDDYIEVVLDGSAACRAEFLSGYALQAGQAGRSRIWRLLEGQRHAMLMFTSCGWFFDDVDGIEARQILRYAGRALEVAGSEDMRSKFLAILETARSNRPDADDGRRIFEDELGRSMVPPGEIAAWWGAASSVAGTTRASGDRPVFPAWDVAEESRREEAVDAVRLITGRVSVASRSLEEENRFDFAAVFGLAGDLSGGIRPAVDTGGEDPSQLLRVLRERGVASAIEVIEERYGLHTIGLETLARLRRSQPDHRGEARGAYAAQALVSLAGRWAEDRDPSALDLAESMLGVVDDEPVTPDLWEAQNAWYRAARSIDSEGLEIEPGQRERLASIATRLGLNP